MRRLFHLIAKGSHILQKYEQFTIGLAFERAARRAEDPGTDTRDDGDDSDEEEVYGDEDIIVPDQARISHDTARVHPATMKFFDRIVVEMDQYDEQDESGRLPYAQWESVSGEHRCVGGRAREYEGRRQKRKDSAAKLDDNAKHAQRRRAQKQKERGDGAGGGAANQPAPPPPPPPPPPQPQIIWQIWVITAVETAGNN